MSPAPFDKMVMEWDCLAEIFTILNCSVGGCHCDP